LIREGGRINGPEAFIAESNAPLYKEWIWAAILCAAPFAAFGALELAAVRRRRRAAAIAHRSKSRIGGIGK